MTEAFWAAGRRAVSGPDVAAPDEAVLIDRLIDLVLALEPIEHKQTNPPESETGETTAPDLRDTSALLPAGSTTPAARLAADSTGRMLAQMRLVLDRESARLGEDGLEGKAAVDLVSLIARTLEKIDQMERLISDDQARASGQTLSHDEREQLRQTVRQLILSAAERMAVERAGEPESQRDGGAGAETPVRDCPGQEIPDQEIQEHETPEPGVSGPAAAGEV